MNRKDPSALSRKLAEMIARDGPMSIATYMSAALTNPEFGYYMGQDPLGRDGDFITAPEVSQMFGELIGLWCADTWQNLGAPSKVALVELGPGRGTLMADALRAARQVPAFAAALELHLVEVSPALRAHQAKVLPDEDPHWRQSLAGVPDRPLLLIANEFFDALPVRQLVQQEGGWGERQVTLDEGGDSTFAFSVTAPDPKLDALVPERLRAAPTGSLFETSPAGQDIVREIARRLQAHGGAALIIDYGHGESAPGDTLQAVRRHAGHEVLCDPGTADLTCHVDFAALARAARDAGADVHGPVPQGAFLQELGIAVRAAQLMENATAEQRAEVRSAQQRLTAADQMGTLFKVLAIASEGLGPPAGFP